MMKKQERVEKLHLLWKALKQKLTSQTIQNTKRGKKTESQTKDK